jgi:hypothetical protein
MVAPSNFQKNGKRIRDANNQVVASIATRKFARDEEEVLATIVNAVNCHADLLEALEDACTTYAFYGAQPPEKWLKAVQKARTGGG